MNQNLLYIVARHNVDRIYGDGRFDWIDDDFTEAVVTIGAEYRGVKSAPATRSTSGSKTKMAAMAARTRGRTTR